MRLVAGARDSRPSPAVTVSLDEVEPPGNDPASIERLLLLLLPRVRAWTFRLVGPRGDFEDVVQEALTELATALPRFEGRSRLTTFAHRVVLRAACRAWGRKQRRAEVSLELVPAAGPEGDPEARATGREALRRLYRALERLPEKRRVAFVLCAVEGLLPHEAAEIEGTSAEAMRSRLMHARQELASLLRDDPYLGPLADREAR